MADIVSVLPGRAKGVAVILATILDYEPDVCGTDRIAHNTDDIRNRLKMMLPADSTLPQQLMQHDVSITMMKLQLLLGHLTSTDFTIVEHRFLLWLAFVWARQWVTHYCTKATVADLAIAQINEVLFGVTPTASLSSSDESRNALSILQLIKLL